MNQSKEISFPVVGIGSSAGGITALKEFLSNLTETDSEMAFVIVQHLSPEHKSTLAHMLQKHTRMPVQEVNDEMEIKPNHVYIIPPDSYMEIKDGRLHLTKPLPQHGKKLPIDYFFRSLAHHKQEQAVCIILSGAGTDGTLGLKAIKEESGMVMAQDPKTAEHNSMPRSAISTGLVDYILPPSELPSQLFNYIHYAFKQKANIPPLPTATDALQEIFNLLYNWIGYDFSQYKYNTIRRRIERRMAVKHIKRIEDYVAYLSQNSQEIEALFREILVGVTSFFREPEAFEYLKQQIIPGIFQEKSPGDTIRIWVPGCSTGEEAYSIAILVQEYLENIEQNYQVNIFATDIDSRAIEHARSGEYPINIAANISPERLKRFFYRDTNGSTYYIKNDIRDMLVFAEQNAAEDPPFTKLDLISCRNLLIFMDLELQKKLLYLFHYSLNENGYLFLGISETIGELTELFEPVGSSFKIYKRKSTLSYLRPAIKSSSPFIKSSGFPLRSPGKKEVSKSTNIRNLVEKKLLQNYTPTCAVVNESGEIIYIHGRSSNYLEPPQGEANINILQMARNGLRVELREAFRKVAAQKETVYYQGLKVRSHNEVLLVNLTVSPILEETSYLQDLIMVVFEDISVPQVSPPETAAAREIVNDKDKTIVNLEQELRDKEEYLQATIEELETSNEELQSLNEEYQSTNEELETSKEELQSVNEELSTVNTELQNKIEELSQAHNDIKNMLTGTGIGTLFVDTSLHIKRFTIKVTEIINLIESDIGRPLNHFSLNLKHEIDLVQEVISVLNTLKPQEFEVKTKDNIWYLVRIFPYRTTKNAIEGAVITFIEITEKKQLEENIHRLAVIVKDSNDAIIMLDFEGNILAWNPQAEHIYGWSENEVFNKNILEVVPGEKSEETLEMIQKLGKNTHVEPFQTKRLSRNGDEINIWLTASTLRNQEGIAYALVATERPVNT